MEEMVEKLTDKIEEIIQFFDKALANEDFDPNEHLIKLERYSEELKRFIASIKGERNEE
jgi:Asp-tRNA(Asn)/Glu-tRNA(Gln) amidotransferase C subunit